MKTLKIKNENPARIPAGLWELYRVSETDAPGEGIYILGVDFSAPALQRLADFHIIPKGIIRTPVDRAPEDEYPEAQSFETLQTLNGVTVIVGFSWSRNASFLREICDYSNVSAVYVLEGAEYMWTMMFEPQKGLFRTPKLRFVDSYYQGVLRRNLTYGYFSSYRKEFEQTYQWLADDLSRETMTAFLNGHVNLTTFPMDSVRDKSPQYFAPDIVKLSNRETFVDCGGYDGDTVREFMNQSRKKFRKIYIFEPDKKMLPTLREQVAHLENCVLIEQGAFNRTGIVGFDNENCGMITDNAAGEMIETVRLEDAITDEVSFIKMDIEGAELEALEGAKGLIEQYHPKLAICVYHKREDLIKIPQFIKSLRTDYALYLRGYFSYVAEVVLYAIPQET